MEKHKPLILVTGANGQLGREIQDLRNDYPDMDFLFMSKIDFDITLESRVHEYVAHHKPSAILNCAAYTNVEKAEEDREMADLANARAPQFLADACGENDVLLIHISTDYVFDGQSKVPYRESDAVNPLNYYGESKLFGERAIDETLDRYFTFRTSWLYSHYGHNFYKTMKRLAAEHGHLKVVKDQIASPTYAGELATDLLWLLRKTLVKKEHVDYGLYHYTQSGEASWFDFANEIMKLVSPSTPVEPVTSEAFPTKAMRPSYSKLNTSAAEKLLEKKFKTWQEALQSCVNKG